MTCRSFNIRVYGLLFNDRGEVLLTDEIREGMEMTKFPGGGLESREGLIDCLKREFREELNISIRDWQHFYTTDFYQESVFDGSQVISVYYTVKTDEEQNIPIVNNSYDFNGQEQIFRWKALENLTSEELTFPIDRTVLEMLKNQ